MKQYWLLFSAYIEERKLSERILMFTAAAGVLITLGNALLLNPLFTRGHALRIAISQHQAQLAALADQTRTLAQAAREPHKNIDETRLHTLERDLAQIKISLDELLQHQVPPQKMAALLEDVLKNNQQVRLIAFKTLPVVQFNPAPPPTQPVNHASALPISGAAAPPSAAQLFYQHGVELTVEGNYAALLSYLDILENLPWQLFWGDLRFSVEDYPRERVTVVLYTLCGERIWLSM